MIPTNVISIFAVIFCSISQVCFSRELPVQSSPPPQNESISSEADITLEFNAVDRATHAAYHIEEILRNYTLRLPNITDPISPLSSPSNKKAASTIYIQDDNDVTGGLSLQGLTGWTTIDLVPYFLENVVSPLVKHVINGNYTSYFRGSSAAAATPAPSVVHHPSKEPVIDYVEEEAAIATTKKTRTRATTTKASTTTTEQTGRNLEEENDKQAAAPISPTKTKYRVRIRERASTTTTGKPLINQEDDEDESKILNKIKHL